MENEKDVQDIRERLIRIETLLESNRENTEEKIRVANHRITEEQYAELMALIDEVYGPVTTEDTEEPIEGSN